MRRAVIGAVLLLVALSHDALPCSTCVKTEARSLAARRFPLVFLGEVVSWSRISSGSHEGKATYKLKVLREWKGRGEPEYSVVADPPAEPTTCVFDLTIGEKYIVFAGGDGPMADCAFTEWQNPNAPANDELDLAFPAAGQKGPRKH
jgi:hypothetical protein